MAQKLARVFCLCIAGVIVCNAVTRNASAVEEVIRRRERLVEEIAASAEALYINRLSGVRSCTCSSHDCAHDFGPDNAMECTSDLLFETCEDDCGERLVNYNRTVIRTPLGTNPKVLSNTLKQSICTFAPLEEDFKKVRDDDGLTNSWTYIGLQDGHFRTWPLRARGRHPSYDDPYLGNCKHYDPRRRPWYNAASTGPKDVVIVVDRSASTVARSGRVGENASIWASAQQAVLKLLDTFIHADFVNVVLFSSEAEVLWKEGPFAEAVPENRDVLKNEVRKALPFGSTNIVAGFDKAIDLFVEGAKQGITSKCNKIIIFLAEGRDTRLKTSEVLARIDEAQQRLRRVTGSSAYIFSYSIGLDADDATAQQIACANQGLWSSVRNFADPLSDMNNYLETIATTRGSQQAVWVDPYEDSSGLGILTTVSMPVFSRGKKGDLPRLLGVVGHDVILDDLVVEGYDAETVLKNLVTRSKRCEALQIAPCDLQVSRFIENPRKQCVDVYPQRRCYQFGDRWYRRFEIQRTQPYAERFCRDLNGTLAPIRSLDHLRFLSALASPDKSWIGGQRVVGLDPIHYEFQHTDAPPINQYFIGWARSQPGQLRERCMTIDRRSIAGNLQSMMCEASFDFICEFPTSEAAECQGDTLKVTKKDGKLKTFSMPYPEECPQMEKANTDASTLQEAEDVLSGDVICDFGRPVFHEELYCCKDCHNHTVQFPNATQRSTSNIVLTLFSLFFSVLLLCHI